MLWYKAWLESRARFLLSAGALTALCMGFAIFHRNCAYTAECAHSHVEYIWRIVYKGFVRELFVLLAILLGVGGLLRERDYGTATFTLSLPASRWRLVAVRATLGLLEVVALSWIPALLIPLASSLVGEAYPWSQAWQFALLWSVCGAFLFAFGFLASTFFAGEYTAPVVAIAAMLGYSLLAGLPQVERIIPDVHDLMSGADTDYFDPKLHLLTGPLPWALLGVIGIATCCAVSFAGKYTDRQDF